MRLLIWLALAVIVFFAIRSRLRSMQNDMRNAVKAEFEAQATVQKAASQPENMVECSYCHIYLPASEAVHVATPNSSQFFCSEEHLRLHASGTPAASASQHSNE